MKWQQPTHKVIAFPTYRRWMVAAYRSAQHRHTIHGLLDVDVTQARAILREQRAQTGASLSFTAFLCACLAKAVDEHKDVQAYHQGNAHLVVYDDVDIYTVIEHDLHGQKYIIPYIIRAANRKTLDALHHEIRAAQAVDTSKTLKRWEWMYAPTMLYKLFFWAFMVIGRWYPRLWKMTVGTVGISSVGRYGVGAGGGIPAATPSSLMLTVGGIGQKLVLVDGQVVAREYLSLTLSVDHDLVDGAPAARFTRRLKELIESAYGLEALASDHESARQAVATTALP